MPKLQFENKKFLISLLITILVASGIICFRESHLGSFLSERFINQPRKATQEEVDFVEELLTMTKIHFEVLYKINSQCNLTEECCHAKFKYMELVNSNERAVKESKKGKIQECREEISIHLRAITRLYDEFGKIANLPNTTQYSYFNIREELFYQIRLISERIMEFVISSCGGNVVQFTNEDRANFDKLILKLPGVLQKRASAMNEEGVNILDCFIVFLGSEELVNQYNDMKSFGNKVYYSE